MRPRPFTILLVVAAVAGFLFASFSTYDFAAHLDRQVHGIHCSFIPGLTGTDASGSSGCHVTMMSPYSSVFRQAIWGGIPVSLPAMGVFAFLLYRGLALFFGRREDDQAATRFLVAAAALPLLTSLGMGTLSLAVLHAACKLCIGIYTSSVLVFIGAVGAWRTAGRQAAWEAPEESDEPVSEGTFSFAAAFGVGVLFVAAPVGLYVAMAPDFSDKIGACGELATREDPAGVLVPLDSRPGGRQTIEVLDPLCPSCAAFESRLGASGLGEQLDRKALLFPLDNTCNWMISDAMHPGACAISEAVLCADAQAPQVVAWAFEHQEAVRAAAAADPKAAAAMVEAAFPAVKGCVGSAKVKARLNRSLRWAVSNKLPVMTPQVYVDGVKLCDEDTDLGMDWALSRLLAKGAAGEAR